MMKTYKTLETLNLTVLPGSVVVLSDEQYEFVKDSVEPVVQEGKKNDDKKKDK